MKSRKYYVVSLMKIPRNLEQMNFEVQNTEPATIFVSIDLHRGKKKWQEKKSAQNFMEE